MHDLDSEVVKTKSKRWRDIKMGIAGSARVLPPSSGKNKRQHDARGRGGGRVGRLAPIPDAPDAEGSGSPQGYPPANAFSPLSLNKEALLPPSQSVADGDVSSPKPNEKVPFDIYNSPNSPMSEATLRLMQMCDDLEQEQGVSSKRSED